MAEDVDPEDARQAMAERHFMLSQAVIDRFEQIHRFLEEAETALEGSGHVSLAEKAHKEAELIEEQLKQWRGFQDEVGAFLDLDEGDG